MWWTYVVGFGLALLFNQTLTRWVSSALWRGIGWRGNEVADPNWSHAWHTRAIGAIEAIIFTGSVALGHLELIAIWLALKVAGSWKGWEESQELKYKVRAGDADPADRTLSVPGRTVFNIFLLGTALSLIGGCIGGLTVEWLLKRDVGTTVTVWVALSFATLLLLVFARHYQDRWPPLQEGEERVD